jgi:hypothetical protein
MAEEISLQTYGEEDELGAVGGGFLDGRTRMRDVASLIRRDRELAQRHLELRPHKKLHTQSDSNHSNPYLPPNPQKFKPGWGHLGERRGRELERGRGARGLRAEGGGGSGHGDETATAAAAEEANEGSEERGGVSRPEQECWQMESTRQCDGPLHLVVRGDVSIGGVSHVTVVGTAPRFVLGWFEWAVFYSGLCYIIIFLSFYHQRFSNNI